MKRIAAIPFHLVLLPLFFSLHGWVENLGIVFFNDAVKLAGWYMLVALILFGLSWLLFRDISKAGIFAFGLLAFNFFFGAVHDTLKKMETIPFISRYVFVLPLSLVLLVLFFILLRRTRKRLLGINAYLNLLLVVLILFDLFQLSRIDKPRENRELVAGLPLKPCPGCPRPDIYLILTDGYPSNIQLKENLGYDNSLFLDRLKQRGFFVADSSRSNYNMTPVSVASLLDMTYFSTIQGTSATYKKDVALALERIRNSSFPAYLRSQGYGIHNHSIFDLKEEPSRTEPTFLPKRTSNITSQTFVNRVLTDLGFHLIDKFNIRFVVRYSRNADLRNNNRVYEKTIRTAREAKTPKFVYTHLMMPHYPYYYDSTGRQRALEELTTELISDTTAFISYLKYANGKLLGLIDEIEKSSASPPLILLVSDHGFRNFKQQEERDHHFMNLLAVKYPGGDKGGLYHSMTNVNLFRILLNDRFGQRLPLLTDSTRLLLE